MIYEVLSVLYFSNLEKFSCIYSVWKYSHFHVLIFSASHHQSGETINFSLPLAFSSSQSKGLHLFLPSEGTSLRSSPWRSGEAASLSSQALLYSLCSPSLHPLSPSAEITQTSYFYRLASWEIRFLEKLKYELSGLGMFTLVRKCWYKSDDKLCSWSEARWTDKPAFRRKGGSVAILDILLLDKQSLWRSYWAPLVSKYG